MVPLWNSAIMMSQVLLISVIVTHFQPDVWFLVLPSKDLLEAPFLCFLPSMLEVR